MLMTQPCVLCSETAREELPLETAVIQVKAPRQVVRCVKCGLVSIEPIPSDSELFSFYEKGWLIEEYAKTQPLLYPVGDVKPEPYIIERLAMLENRVGKGKILDVGAANGVFLSAARERGWQVAGLELSSKSIAEAKSRFGLDLVQATLGDTPFQPESFDVIHMSHVLEHINRPVTALQQARALLKPNGLLFIEVPNEFDELFSLVRTRMLRRSAIVYEVPTPHIYFYTARTLCKLLCAAGFDSPVIHTPYRNPETGSRIPMGGLVKRCIYWAGVRLKKGPVLDAYAGKRAS